MSNSYRIRTQVGVDKSIKVLLDQEFEFLEILSFKILQSQIYTRQCSDYGVIVGRVTANDGFGLPNVKVSIFVPLETGDENNPVITDLYPYRTLSELNADGYRYNLLPYQPTYSAHVPTGTFFDRQDVLLNPALIEVYDKYYKYNAITNDSGDYMIFGVPTGTQTIHVDIDLSDIGEFSLSPQDLIRMGRATEAQVNGNSFKSSNNLNELPQIVTINRTIEVEPLWGEPQVCNLGITRTDFDLTNEANITIQPTAIFMGSIFSSPDSQYVKRNCRPTKKVGELCSLVSNSGKILAIRQTPFQDIDGRPVLEQYELESGGEVIDDNGTWLVDIPMNLDYVITNEFGEQVLSPDPQKGIPTKGKYRFKVKWNQSPSLATPIRRGYFLVPNIKEWGWNNSNQDPYLSPFTQKSYAFSLDWNDYGFSGNTIGRAMIQEAIDCVDRFYQMEYNQVYTISQLIDQFRGGPAKNKYIAIKNILDETCESTINKFPTNDAQYRQDILYLLFLIMMWIFKPILIVLPIVLHILALVITIIAPVLAFVVGILLGIVTGICYLVSALSFGAVNCSPLRDILKNGVKTLWDLPKQFRNIPLPNLTYPDCELCVQDDSQADFDPALLSQVNPNVASNWSNPGEWGAYSVLTPFETFAAFSNLPSTCSDIVDTGVVLAGLSIIGNNPTPGSRAPQYTPYIDTDGTKFNIFTTSLPTSERLNLFNTKAKYFTNPLDANNPGGGVNRIKVTFNPPGNIGKFHLDNVLAIVCEPGNEQTFLPGQILTFQDPSLSQDPNLNAYSDGNFNFSGTSSITGKTINNNSIKISYAKIDGSGNAPPVTYFVNQTGETETIAKFPMDIEYFQVITAMTYSNFSAQCNPSITTFNKNSFNRRFLHNLTCLNVINGDSEWQTGLGPTWIPSQAPFYVRPLDYVVDAQQQQVVFLVRGVDPNTNRMEVSYDLSMLFGYSPDGSGVPTGNVVVKGNYKLNYPIQGTFKNVNNGAFVSPFNNDSQISSTYLYYPALRFLPAPNSSPFGFSGFSSNLFTYYSSLGTDINFTPQTNVAPLIVGPQSNRPCLSSSRGYIVKNNVPANLNSGGFNGFLIEPTGRPNPPFFPNYWGIVSTNNPSTSRNRGYFPNEIVEGGSVMSQFIYIPILPNAGPEKATAYYYAPQYSTGLTLNFPSSLGNGTQVSPSRTIMRSDRLPTSTTMNINLGNSFALHTNINFSVFSISDDGTGYIVSPPQTNIVIPDPDITSANTKNFTSAVIESLNDCKKLVPLNCYETDANNTIKVKDPNDDCYKCKLSGKKIMQNGNYILITMPILSLFCDYKIVGEWFGRLQVNFAACRNVWGHIFTNNWINGTLFAYPFKFKNRRILKDYCTDTVILHNDSQNIYYRSSPYFSGNTGSGFIGSKRLVILPTGANDKNLKNPTTIMNLGPRSSFLQELIMSDKFDGYVMNKLQSTSFEDVSEILNLLIISRLANTNFLGLFFGAGGASALSYFSRPKQFVDADYAQMISINSEIGVESFEADNYPDDPPNYSIYYNGANAANGVFGIFFDSDLQIRDYLTPKRTIISPNGGINDSCALSYIGTFSQEVPFYQWEIKQGDPDSIFGSEKNEWYTDSFINGFFFSEKYQSMDRLLPNDRYMRSNVVSPNEFFKGYIFNSIYDVPNSRYINNPNEADLQPNSYLSRVYTVGAPFHFYFGIKVGASAFDRFTTKWINTVTPID